METENVNVKNWKSLIKPAALIAAAVSPPPTIDVNKLSLVNLLIYLLKSTGT